MQLITPEHTSFAGRAFATGIGISEADLTVVRNDITEALRQGPDKTGIEIHVGNNLTSAGLLAEYWRTLSRR
jgi:hypothetical protein